MIPGADPAAAALQQQQMMAMYQQMLLQAMANQVPGMQVPGAAAAAAAQPAAQPVAAAPAVPAEPGKRTGYIKNWNEEKKYGFVSEDGTGEDHFCHRSCLVGEVDELKKGDLVRFDVEMDNSKGRNRAVNVSKTGEGGGPPPKGEGKSSKGEGKKGGKSQEAQALQGLDQAAKEELMKQRKEHMVEMNKMKEELLGQGPQVLLNPSICSVIRCLLKHSPTAPGTVALVDELLSCGVSDVCCHKCGHEVAVAIVAASLLQQTRQIVGALLCNPQQWSVFFRLLASS